MWILTKNMVLTPQFQGCSVFILLLFYLKVCGYNRRLWGGILSVHETTEW